MSLLIQAACLAGFRALPSPPARVPDAGLAVFDRIAPRSRGRVYLPAVKMSPVSEWPRIRALALPALRRSRRCPSCGWTDTRRSMAHNVGDYVLSVFGFVPYRCRTCSGRFHRPRQTAHGVLKHAVETGYFTVANDGSRSC